MKEIIKKCKDNNIEPWYLVDLIMSGSPDLVYDDILTYEENKKLFNLENYNLKDKIMKVYFNNKVEELPEEIKRAADEGMKVTRSAWGLITDWMNGISDCEFDRIGSKWINNDTKKASKVYAYCLHKERGTK